MNLPGFVCCPECHGALSPAETVVKCGQCYQEYSVAPSGQIDLRPRRRFIRTAAFAVDPIDPIWSPHEAGAVPSQAVRDMSVGRLDQIIPKPTEAGSIALEVGCGRRRDVRGALQRAGFAWVGVDWHEESAPYLADIHALPFLDGSFPLVASDAVLEHVRYPHIAIKEMARVLRPGGVMVGEVAFLQPYHVSYFHMTHEAVLDLARYADLEPTLIANGETSPFLYLARRAFRKWAWMVWPADWMFRALVRTRRLAKNDIDFACTVVFAARKPLQ